MAHGADPARGLASDPEMARSVYVSAPPAPSATVLAGQPAQAERNRLTRIRHVSSDRDQDLR